MSYATPTEVASEFKNITFSGTTAVTDVEVQRFLDETDALVNACISSRYTTPITGTGSLLITKRIEIDIVSVRVAKILQIKNATILDKNGVSQDILDGSAAGRAWKLLKQIQDGSINLPDENLAENSGGIKSYTESNNFSPVFERGKGQW